MKTHSIQAAGVRLRAFETGQGPPVVVLHGFTGDAESMESVSRGLADSHRVIALELVGHGGSEAPTDPALYSMEACATQIEAAMIALDLDRPALLGYSMGGRAALSTAVAFPDRFGCLILIGATAGIADTRLRAERIRADEALADRIQEVGVESFVDEWMALPIFASQSRLGAAVLDRARKQRLRNSAAGLAGSLRGMGAGAQRPLFDGLPGLDVPTLLIVGEEDEKFKGIAADLESKLPKARTQVLVAAGHAAHLEAPQDFARVASAFLAEWLPLKVAPAAGPFRDCEVRHE